MLDITDNIGKWPERLLWHVYVMAISMVSQNMQLVKNYRRNKFVPKIMAVFVVFWPRFVKTGAS
jgi:hypothetical protein